MVDKKPHWPPKSKPHVRMDIPPGNTPVIESPNAIVTRAHGPQAQVVQVETLGKYGVFLLFMSAFIAAVAAVGLLFVMFELKTVSAQYEVLQYDQQALKAQLVAKGIYEGTEH